MLMVCFPTTIEGSLISRPNSTFSIDFYLNDVPDPSGYGEGQRYFGTTTVTTDASGLADINFVLPGSAAPGEVITATATDRSGNTSEFSLDTSVTSEPRRTSRSASPTRPTRSRSARR